MEELVGNGSVVNIQYQTREGISQNGAWFRAIPKAVQVVNLVEFKEDEFSYSKQKEVSLEDLDNSEDELPY